jgi:hypothetical protein
LIRVHVKEHNSIVHAFDQIRIEEVVGVRDQAGPHHQFGDRAGVGAEGLATETGKGD